MNTERDKFLTEAMGECWHELEPYDSYTPYFGNREYTLCKHCLIDVRDIDKNYNFSTWAGFGKLWEWAQKQGWWKIFKQSNVIDLYGIPECRITIPDVLINPDIFANAVYNYLKEKQQ